MPNSIILAINFFIYDLNILNILYDFTKQGLSNFPRNAKNTIKMKTVIKKESK